MNVNIKLSLTDQERNVLKCKLAGKEVKALATRADVNEMVNGFIRSMLDDAGEADNVGDSLEVGGGQQARSHRVAPATRAFDQSLVPEKYRHMPVSWQVGWFRGRYVLKSYRT